MPEAMPSQRSDTPSPGSTEATERPIAEPKVSRTKDNATASAVPARIAPQST